MCPYLQTNMTAFSSRYILLAVLSRFKAHVCLGPQGHAQRLHPTSNSLYPGRLQAHVCLSHASMYRSLQLQLRLLLSYLCRLWAHASIPPLVNNHKGVKSTLLLFMSYKRRLDKHEPLPSRDVCCIWSTKAQTCFYFVLFFSHKKTSICVTKPVQGKRCPYIFTCSNEIEETNCKTSVSIARK